MATYDAGVMRSEYVLDLTNLERNARRAKQILDDLAKAEATATAPKPATPRATSARGADPAVQAAKAEAAILRQASAQAALAKAEGDSARAAQIFADALTKVDRSSIAAIRSQTQYTKLLNVKPPRQTDPAKAHRDAEAAILRQARAESMLAQAQGDTARAAQILATALDKVDKSTVGAINVQTQHVRLLGRLEAGATSAAGRLQVLPRTIAGLSNEAAAFATSAIGITSVGAAVAVLGSAMTDAADRTRQIKLALGELSDAEIQGISAAAVQLKAQYGTDLQAQLNTTRVVMRSFGVDGVEATRIIQAGFANGIDVSGDFLDTLTEYAPYFKTLGLNAEQSLGVLQRGLQAGARNTDYIGDALKELTIRIQDVATVGKLEGLDAGMASVVSRFQDGEITAAAAFDAIRNGLAAVEDDTLRNALGVELYGTKWEDLQGSVVTAMTDIEASTVSVSDLNTGFQTLGEIGPRSFAAIGTALQPINNWLIGIANNVREVMTLSQQLDNLQAGLVGTSTDYEDYKAREQQARAMGASLDYLTRAQFEYAQSLMAQGQSEAAATQAAQARADSLNTLNASITVMTNTEGRYADILGDLGPTMIAIAASGDQYLNKLIELNQLHQSGSLSAEGLREAISALAYNAGVATEAQASLVDQLFTFRDIADPVSAALGDLIDKNSILSTIVGNLTNATVIQTDAARNAAIATLTEAANTEIAALKQREFDDAITSAVGSSASAEQAALQLAAIYQGVSVPALVELINLRRELNALEGTGLVGNLGGMARSARAVATQVKRDMAQIARATGPVGRGSALRAPTRTVTEDPAIRQARESAARIEQIERDHLSRMRDIQSSYALSATRNREDFEREKQRLLAEGNIREAQLLEEKYATESRRAAEDQAIKERDEQMRTAERIADERAKQPNGGVPMSASAAPPPGAPPPPAPAAIAAASGESRIRVEFAPIALHLDGQRVAEVVYPPIEQRLTEGLTTVQVTAPPNATQSTGVGGPRA